MPPRVDPPSASAPLVWCDLRTVIGLAWLIGFCLWFASFDLPNNLPATRAKVWPAVPLQLLEIVWPLPEANAPPSGVRYLPQRLPALLTAIGVIGAALGLGLTVLRGLGVLRELDWEEAIYFAGGIGLSLGSLVVLGLGLAGCLQPWLFWLLVIAGNGLLIGMRRRVQATEADASFRSPRPRLGGEGEGASDSSDSKSAPSIRKQRNNAENAAKSQAYSGWIGVAMAVCGLMIWAMLLGALTPQSDFDVLAYHLNGPKEWFESGRISFLPHNVYTSFPFLTEMHLLAGMVLLHDASYGALAGQAVLMAFAPLTALGLYAAGRRWFGEGAGRLAALVWLTTPWAYRISIIAYAEGGLAFYVLASFLAAERFLFSSPRPRPGGEGQGEGDDLSRSRKLPPTELRNQNELARFPENIPPLPRRGGEGTGAARNLSAWCLLAGFLAGSAMACKYPGLITVVVPIGLGLGVTLLWQKTSLRSAAFALAAYGLGVVLAVGPWLVKNYGETGNPVYPLAYSVFGGTDLDPELNAKWVKGHAAKQYESLSAGLRDFGLRFADVIADNDWHSPLLYGLAPLSFFWVSRRREVILAWLFLGWLFLAWFFLTHHVDRFWVPMIPVVCLLAGGGAMLFHTQVGRWFGGVTIAAMVAFNLTICSLLGGYNSGLTELSQAQRIAEASLTPEIRWLNDEYARQKLPADFKLLCEGEAATFHARFPVAYHAVFDRSLLEEWCAAGPGPDFPLKSAAEIRAELKRHGITHVFVNWRWIQTYREPRNYGFTDFVHPDRFRTLQELGILGPALPLPEPLGRAPLDDDRRAQLQAWAPTLIVNHRGEPGWITGQIFPVLP